MKYLAIAFSILSISACGALKVDHDVSGSVQLNVTVTPADFEKFFATDCALRTVGQPCYDPDPVVCAACMSQALFTTLTVPH